MQCINERASRLTTNFGWDRRLPNDTESASRAIVVTRKLAPGQEWDFLKSVQKDFYVQNADVTKAEVHENLAVKLGMDALQFRQTFQDPQTKPVVWEEFDQARQLGLTAFRPR
jgi:putative protein-disulfide isomerase